MRKVRAVIIGVAVLLGSAGIVHTQGQRGQGQRGAVQLPEGPGREILQANCTRCHGLNLITNSAGFSKAVWESLIPTMVVLPVMKTFS